MFSLISGWWYIMGWVGVRKEWRKVGLCRGNWGVGRGLGEGKIMEWDKHHYPMYIYDYTNGVTLLHVQPEKQLYPICVQWIKTNEFLKSIEINTVNLPSCYSDICNQIYILRKKATFFTRHLLFLKTGNNIQQCYNHTVIRSKPWASVNMCYFINGNKTAIEIKTS